MKASKPIAGRHLGWSDSDLRSKPYARLWRPQMAPLAPHARLADEGPLAEPLLPPISRANDLFAGGGVENGFALTPDGGMRIAIQTEMPDVTPAMIDWWFGWHSDSPERYKLWHPNAHVHALWQKTPQRGTRGRKRYINQTSIVDEYIGSNLLRLAISFIDPDELALTDPSLQDDMKATAICAHSTSSLRRWCRLRGGKFAPPRPMPGLLSCTARRKWLTSPRSCPRPTSPSKTRTEYPLRRDRDVHAALHTGRLCVWRRRVAGDRIGCL